MLTSTDRDGVAQHLDHAGAPGRAPGCLLCVVGARPNFIKMAPIVRALARHGGLPPSVLVHTGQHYDAEMSEGLFVDLGLPPPDVNLEVGSGSHALQTAEVMRRFEPQLERFDPRCVIVVGDVNSTLACSLVAAKCLVPVVHVEAGLRSFDRGMPEEINRVLTDQLAELLFTTERSAHVNLAREGVDAARVHFVGNVMIDSLLEHRARAPAPQEVLARARPDVRWMKDATRYAVVTLHRPSNVDDPQALARCLEILQQASRRLPVICALHPRTRANIERFGLGAMLARETIATLPPQSYLAMLGLMAHATLVITDSGGVQEETTALGVPCLTLRDNTERPVTVEQGTNTLVGGDCELALSLVDEVLATGGKRGRIPELWDGRAAQRIATQLGQWLRVPAPRAGS